MIVKAKLAMLFQHGYFDPDRHTGNFLVDASKKTIYFLDWGQLEKFEKFLNPFTVESGIVIGKFIEGLNNLDVDQVLKYAKEMAKDDSEGSIDEEQLRQSLKVLFAKPKQKGSIDIKQLMVDAINDIAESGLKFQTRYIFGGLKGLIMLFGEKYVEEATFKKILTDELTGLFLREMPAILMESLSSDKKPTRKPLSRGQQCRKALSSKP
jgi:predicted unusual protein kinase regulating ubiquinone biosynthesis (AarF/ABC1/UbiB family)